MPRPMTPASTRSRPRDTMWRASAHAAILPGAALVAACVLVPPAAARAQAPRPLLPIEFVHSAEYGWLRKPVQASRVLDDMTAPGRWRLSGTGTLTFPEAPRLGDMRALRVDMQLSRGERAPTRSGLPSVNLQRQFDGEDWTGYNRLSLWVRPEFSGIPVLPLQIVLHNDGVEKVPDRYAREGTHYVSFMRDGWQQIVWEIEPLARDRVTRIEIGYFVNKMLAGAEDRVAFELGRLELQRVEPDHHTGWSVAPGRIAFSHSGYQTGSSKTALASGLAAGEFELLRVNDHAFGEVRLRRTVRTVPGAQGEFQLLDFSDVETPGRYVLRAGAVVTQPFAIGGDVWKPSVWKTLNFFYGNRCGFDVPGVHGVDHLDWFATHGDRRIPMSGGWHDAGDLSQGVINTGEGTYAMFLLAERLMERGDPSTGSGPADPALVERLIEEATWGLDWVLRVRFEGGQRMGFASHNYWTNNVAGDDDDKLVETRNNPNANYIAAAAGAIAHRVLRTRDPERAARSLRIAADDWAHAIVGVEGPSTWHTPAFAASRMELAAIGVTASVELYRATGEARYRDKAVELARIVTASQQQTRVGRELPLSGFFYTGPDQDTLFHQFHRAADQAPILALSQLVELLPNHPEWMRWYATVARHAEFQKRSAAITAPYGVLPAYVYRLADSLTVPDTGGRYLATRDAYAAQVRAGTPMGDGWWLRAFPVWFQRRGNYGVLLSQATGLSAASRLRGDSAGTDLAQRQAQWVVGRNPFVQSTMYGEGYDWAQQYSVSSADFVGSLPVGMQSRGMTDLPYWPSQNMYVYKEVWVHPSNRWLTLMADLLAAPPASSPTFDLVASEAGDGEVTLRLTARGTGTHAYALRVDNLRPSPPARSVTLRDGRPATIEWRARRVRPDAPWVAVVVEDGDATRRREAFGH